MQGGNELGWGWGRYPTWVTLLCKGHYVDPIQVIFLKEKRVNVCSWEERNTMCVRGNNIETGRERETGMDRGWTGDEHPGTNEQDGYT